MVAATLSGMESTGVILALVGVMVGFGFGLYAARRWLWPADDPARGAGSALVERAVVQEGLDRLHDQLRDLEHQRSSWQGQFAAQVADMRASTDTLRRETTSLATALRKPQVRGQWGELHLRRCVELAGLVAHCDFGEQVKLVDREDGRGRRPDLVVHLAGGRDIVVDAKVPLDAFMDATTAEADDERDHHIARHVGQVRRHVDQLADRKYWQGLADTPELVVMFLPAESFLVAALETQTDLLAHAASRNVVLATPMTLIALLRTVAHDWRQEAVTERAREIHQLGVELHRRIGTLGDHFDQLGRSLNAAVGHFNGAVGSWESRVLVSARRFEELVPEETLESPRPVEGVARPVRRLSRVHDGPDRRAAHSDRVAGPTVEM